MKATACAILALVALAVVAQTTEAAFCHTSSYKVASTLAKTNKEAIYKACATANKTPMGSPMIYKVETKPDGCTLIYQKVASSAAWDSYSACEKSKSGVDNTKLYGPLSAQSAPCAKYQTKSSC
jgi:hypothetical protein